MTGEDLRFFLGGWAAMAGTAWFARGRIRVLRRFDAARGRALEVTASITKLDRAVDRVKAIPTFSFRTFDGADVVARSKVVADGKKEIAQFPVGGSMRVVYDPEDHTWVVPATARTRDFLFQALMPVFVYGLFSGLAIAIPFLPQ